jgi:hypothetical protein
VHGGAGEALDEQVADQARVAVDGLAVGAQHEVAVQAEVARGDGRRAAVVALDAADRDDDIGAALLGVGEQELELAHLVFCFF